MSKQIVKKSSVLPPLPHDLAIIEQFGIPAMLFIEGHFQGANKAFFQQLTPFQAHNISKNQKVQQTLHEVELVQQSLSINISSEERDTFHCLVVPLKSAPRTVAILLEDISTTVESERNNALLYRLSLLFASTQQPLREKIQATVDQVLFEFPVYNCSIFLFNKIDGQLHPVAWGTNSHLASISGRSTFVLGEGIAGYVAKTLQPLVVPDILADSRFVRKITKPEAMAMLCVPIVMSSQMLGVVCASRKPRESFSDQDVQLFTTIASRLADLIVAERARKVDMLQNKWTQQIDTLEHVTGDLSRILPLFGELLEVDTVDAIVCQHDETRLIASASSKKLLPNDLARIEKIITHRRIRAQLKKQEAVVLQELLPPTLKSLVEKSNLRGHILLPLVVHGDLFGVLHIGNRQWNREFTENELALGVSAAMQLAVAVENQQYYEEILNGKNKLDQIQNTIQDGIILYTKDLKIAMYNQAARRIRGFKQDLVGLPWKEVLWDKIEKYCKYKYVRHFDPRVFFDRALKEGKVSVGLSTVYSSSPKTLEVRFVPVFDRHGEINGVLTHFRDITPMHELQQKMAKRVQQLTYLFRISSITGYNIQQLVKKTINLIIKLLSVKACQLVLFDAEDQQLYVVESGGNKALLTQLDDSLHKKIQWVTKRREPKVVRIRVSPDRRVQALIVPICGHEDECIGALVVAEKTDHSAFSREDIDLLSIAASRIAIKIDNAWLVQQIGRDREKLEAVIEQSVDGILVTDAERRVQIWNPALERLTGILEKEAKGQSDYALRELIQPLERNDYGSVSESKIQHRKTGKIFWLGTAYAPIVNNGETTGYVGIVRDISRQKELEIAKNEFLSTASHELRSPLTAIVGYLSMLKRGDAGRIINQQQGFFVDKAYQNAKRMVDLVEDLLTTTRMETKQIRYQLERIDLIPLLENVISDARFKAEEKDITVQLKTKNCQPVLADYDGVYQVASNLLNNAIKYTPEKGKVFVEFSEEKHNGQSMLVTAITDTGVGIDAANREKIFNKFARVDNPLSVQAGGAGLGLYITKSIVKDLGGEIWFTSEENKGSTFYFSLPTAGRSGNS